MASVSCLSGPAGVSLKPIFQGTQVWVKWINTRGGVNGHPVNLIVYDDACDPSRHRAQVQEAVEQRKVHAFLGNVEAVTGQPSVEYVTQKRVPVVGVSLGETWAYSSPMYFPQASTGHPVISSGLAAAAQQLLPEGKKKLASVVCAEAQLCRDGDMIFGKTAKEYGFEHVYRAQSSLAQPDFTAECLNARNAGADVMIILMDTNSINRIASSCARQGYKPNYATVANLITADQGGNQNLAGMSGSSSTFPWVQTGTPAADEFQQAMQTFGSKIPPGLGPATGWTSGLSFAERGLGTIKGGPTKKGGIRFLALAGVANAVMFFLYQLPFGAITTLWPHPWPEDIVKRPYLTNTICGPGTGWDCPSEGNLEVRRSESR